MDAKVLAITDQAEKEAREKQAMIKATGITPETADILRKRYEERHASG